MPTHKKGHDKDKYYHLAKDQGFRSRAAFKLIQINKRYDFLSKSKVLIDLCAAPGGWCQVAAKTMPTGSIILGIDLLPIRAIRNVKTIVSDITSAECRKMVSSELNGWKADVVLCDGAPNIGAAYNKDAYVQNELVLAALKTATEHLAEGGTFCTKVYRSVDYNAIVWVLQQLFEDVQAMKPNSSRSQSSEIFLVCLKYTAPKHIDPKLLDPNHVFKEVSDPGLKTVDVLHKKYDKLNKRHRTGYEENAGPLLTRTATVSEFIASTDPVRMLTDTNQLLFSEDCEHFQSHALTTPEMLICFADLRVLGKIDFKKMLKWRQRMRDESQAEKQAEKERLLGPKIPKADMLPKLTEEEQISSEIVELQTKENQLQRKESKKSRMKASKQRLRQAAGINNNAFEVGEDEELFSLASGSAAKLVEALELPPETDLEAVHDVLHDEELQDECRYSSDEEAAVRAAAKGQPVFMEDDLEAQLEEAYLRFVSGRKAIREEQIVIPQDNFDTGESSRVKRRRAERESKALIAAKSAQDAATLESGEGQGKKHFAALEAAVEGDVASYVQLLSGSQSSVGGKRAQKKGTDGSLDDISSDSDDGDDADDDDTAGVFARTKATRESQTKADQWFSHPIFKERVATGGGRSPADRMLAEMPRTDKDVRKEKRKKALERQERRDERKAVIAKRERGGDDDDDDFGTAASLKGFGFEVAPREEEYEEVKNSAITPEVAQQRKLLRDGMGKLLVESDKVASGQGGAGFEVVPQQPFADDESGPAHGGDGRSYDSDEEDYDARDRTMTLALGTLMLRTSRKKALIDASYNRFTWNDPKDLPDWFMEDELRHNKPQLPVPPALLEQIKSRFQMTGTKEIKKVAEARMRKRKRAMSKLKAAKRQANAMTENSEMSERQKLKAISRAMKDSKVAKPGKVYVVTRKTGAGSVGTSDGGKGKLKFVDKRMKKDRRAERAIKKRGKK